jgi:general secretion pathway protein H
MRPRQEGFTLIELLAVLMVIAIAAGVAATHFGIRQGADTLRATAYELASRYRAARTAAIRQASEQAVTIDMASRMVSSGGAAPALKIPETVSVVTETTATERGAARTAAIRFFPNGASTGGRIRLETGRQAYEVHVNWLTGRVAVERVL